MDTGLTFDPALADLGAETSLGKGAAPPPASGPPQALSDAAVVAFGNLGCPQLRQPSIWHQGESGAGSPGPAPALSADPSSRQPVWLHLSSPLPVDVTVAQ